MKFWIPLLLAIWLFWLITDLRSPSGFQNLFSPLMFTILVMTAVVRILSMLGLGRDDEGVDSGGWFGGGCGGDGGSTGGDGGGCGGDGGGD